MDSIHAKYTKQTDNETALQGLVEVEGQTYEFIYDKEAESVHFDGGPKLGATYEMLHLTLEETVPLSARILARGILHHFAT